MEEVMKRQIRNAISSLMIAAIAGIGLMAFGQNPCGCPQPCVAQPVQPVTYQPVVQEVLQPVAVQPVAQPCPAPCPQPVACPAPCPQGVGFPQPVAFGATYAPGANVASGDPYELAKDIERNADDLRKYFRRSLRCLDCVSDDYYDSVREFERATDRLRHDVKHEDCDVAAQVNEVLRLAECISAYMDPCSLCPEVTEAWTCLQGELQALAAQYCNSVAFQAPISLQPSCPVPAQFLQPVQPVQTVQPVQFVQPAPAPVCCPNGSVNNYK